MAEAVEACKGVYLTAKKKVADALAKHKVYRRRHRKALIEALVIKEWIASDEGRLAAAEDSAAQLGNLKLISKRSMSVVLDLIFDV